MGGWKTIEATQDESIKSYLALALICDMLNGTISVKFMSEELLDVCGVCSQVLVDDRGNERGIRILSDAIDNLPSKSFDIMLK